MPLLFGGVLDGGFGHVCFGQFPTHVPMHESPLRFPPGWLAALFRQVQQIMQTWKNLPSVSAAAQQNIGAWTMSHRSGNEKGESSWKQFDETVSVSKYQLTRLHMQLLCSRLKYISACKDL
jgi:hypothetical protein